jgi:hypothetical protein
MALNKYMKNVLGNFQWEARFSMWGGSTPTSPTIIIEFGGYMFQSYGGSNFCYYTNYNEKDI